MTESTIATAVKKSSAIPCRDGKPDFPVFPVFFPVPKISTIITKAVPTSTTTKGVPTITTKAVSTITTKGVPTKTAKAVPTITTKGVPTIITKGVPTKITKAVPTTKMTTVA